MDAELSLYRLTPFRNILFEINISKNTTRRIQ